MSIPRKNRAGFSLIELLITMAIFSLITLAVGSLFSQSRALLEKGTSVVDLHQKRVRVVKVGKTRETSQRQALSRMI